MTSFDLAPIWEQYCCRLLAFIRSRVSDESQTEDILQNVFIRVHHHLCCLPPPHKMKSWIHQIARNLIIIASGVKSSNSHLISLLKWGYPRSMRKPAWLAGKHQLIRIHKKKMKAKFTVYVLAGSATLRCNLQNSVVIDHLRT